MKYLKPDGLKGKRNPFYHNRPSGEKRKNLLNEMLNFLIILLAIYGHNKYENATLAAHLSYLRKKPIIEPHSVAVCKIFNQISKINIILLPFTIYRCTSTKSKQFFDFYFLLLQHQII